MWNLSDENIYERFCEFEFKGVFTYGNSDKDKREKIREAAKNKFPKKNQKTYSGHLEFLLKLKVQEKRSLT